MANGSTRHGDAATSRLLDESARHEREAAKLRREFEDLLDDVEDDEEDSTVIAAAVGAGVRAALESQHDHDAPSSKPPDMPWWARALPKRFRWVAAVVAALAALLVLLQALAALRDVPVRRAPEQRRHEPALP